MERFSSAILALGVVIVGAVLFHRSFPTHRPSMLAASPNDSARSLSFEWPPQVGHPYPDLQMTDQAGRSVRLSSFKGKVLLIESVGMNCEACLGWSGTDRYGAFQGLHGQSGVHSFERIFEQTTGLSFTDPRVVHIQLLLFNTSMMPTTAEDASVWATHFHRDLSKNEVVLAGSAVLLQPPHTTQTYNLIPGFQLVDKKFILRVDTTSDTPKTNLWTELLPKVVPLVHEV